MRRKTGIELTEGSPRGARVRTDGDTSEMPARCRCGVHGGAREILYKYISDLICKIHSRRRSKRNIGEVNTQVRFVSLSSKILIFRSTRVQPSE